MLKRLSLHARLLLIAGMTGFAALLFAGFAIGNILQNMVRHNLSEKLNMQIQVLERAVSEDGKLNGARAISLPGFDGSSPGWGWRVESPAGQWSGGEPMFQIQMRTRSNPNNHRRRSVFGRPGRAHSQSGTLLFVRQQDLKRGTANIRIYAAGPRFIAERPLREAIAPLLTSLLLLGAALALATWAQLRVGLKPIRDLRDDIKRILAGDAQFVSAHQPKELQPLADEVNALIDQNANSLRHARAHVANLAHGLKTPLATLALKLEREDASEESRRLVAQLDKRIAHHLRRARSASAGKGERIRTHLEPVIGDLLLAMGHIYVDKKLKLERAFDGSIMVALDREDLDEVLGNLLDNACRHAQKTVLISAAIDGQKIRIAVEDDGQGIEQGKLDVALSPGTRLDESGTGYGFGLGIVHELAELNGGSLLLERSQSLGGLKAELLLLRAG